MTATSRDNNAKARKIRFRIFMVIGLLIIVIAPVLTLTIELRQRSYRAYLLSEAARSEEAGDLAAAERYSMRYLELRPGQAESIARLGRIAAIRASEPDEQRQALLLLKSVVASNPGLRRERRLIVDLAMKIRSYSDAIANIQELIDSADPTEVAELDDLRGQCYAGMSEAKNAEEAFRSSITKAPERVDSYLHLAAVLRGPSKDPDAADKVMDALVAANPDLARSYLERSRYRRVFGIKGAKDDLSEARKRDPRDPDVLHEAVASIALGKEKWTPEEIDDLKRTVVAATAERPSESRLATAAAGLELQENDIEGALKSLREGLAANPDAVNVRWVLADILVNAGRIPEAEAEIEALRRGNLRFEVLDYLNARILMLRERWAEAAKLFETSRPVLAQLPILSERVPDLDQALGLCYEKIGDVDRRLEALSRGLDSSGRSLRSRAAYAKALADAGRSEESAQRYGELAKERPEFLAAFINQSIVATRRRPTAEQHWEPIENQLEESKKLVTDASTLALLEAQLRVAQDRPEEAIKVLEQAREKNPGHLELLVEQARTLAQSKGPGPALALLEGAKPELGDSVPARELRATLLASRQGANDNAAIFKLSENVDRYTPNERKTLLIRVATTLSQLGEVSKAEEIWDRVAKEFPTAVAPRLASFDKALRAGVESEMAESIRGLRDVEGEGGSWAKFCEIRMRLWKANHGDNSALSQASSLARELASRRGSWIPLILAQAEIEELATNQDGAIAKYRQALELGHRDPGTLRRLVELLYRARKYDEASTVLGLLRGKDPLQGDLRRLDSDLTYRTQGAEAAIESARKAVDSGSGDPKDYLWLAQLLISTNKRSEVEPILRQAVKLGPKSPETWFALISFLRGSGQEAKAVATATEAEASLPGDTPLTSLAFAQELAGSQAKAESLYRRALVEHPDDPTTLRETAAFELRRNGSQQAEKLLRLLVGHAKARPSDVIWARSNLAALISRGRDNVLCQEALALLDGLPSLGDGSSVEPIEVRRARALVLSREPGRPRIKQARQLFEEVIDADPSRIADQLILAELYEQTGDWEKADIRLSRLMSTLGGNAQFLTAYARLLLRHGRAPSAQPLIESLKKLEPDSLNTAEITARWLKAMNKPEQAAAALESYLLGKDPEQILRASFAMEEIGMAEQAGTGFQTFAKLAKPPLGNLTLAMYLARQHRPSEAVDACEPAWETGDPEKVAQASLYIIDRNKTDKAITERVAVRIVAALTKKPDSITLQLALATVRDMQGRYDEAEALYRKVIDKAPIPTIPLNNLAWLLAFQGGRGDESLKLINRAIAQSGAIGDLLDTRGMAHLAAGNSEKAIVDLEKAVATGETPIRLLHLCQAYLAANNPLAAQKTYKKAVEAGLSMDQLHALERPGYQKVVAELASK